MNVNLKATSADRLLMMQRFRELGYSIQSALDAADQLCDAWNEVVQDGIDDLKRIKPE